MSAIPGTEGLSPTDIQNEIARGARFVVYQWCISLLVVTLKRGTRIYYLKPGETGFLPGFLWSAFTLVAGWWGFPWGPIYTISSLWTNARGGIDVTAAISADLAAQHGAEAPPPLPGAPTGGRWSFGPLAAVGVLAAAFFVLTAGGHYYSQQHRPVALANGLDTAYTAEIDGIARTLRPHSVEKLDLPAGSHSVTSTLPGGIGRTSFTFEAGDATVVNPDGAALVTEETTIYTAQSSPTGENPKPMLHAGKTAYSLSEPDYFLEEFPETVSMSKHATQSRKQRIAVHADLPYARTAEIIERNSGRPAMVAYFKALGARLPNDVQLVGTAGAMLKPAEAKAFFAQHLATRPVLVEWHRAYQNFQRAQHMDAELAAEYRQLAEANPDDGAFAYLLGRLIDNSVEASTWFERALAAKRACAHAHFALAYNAMSRGDFAGALSGLDGATGAGLDNDTIRDQRIECLLALGRPADALKELRKKPAALADFDRAAEEFRLAYAAGGRPAATQVIDTLIARLPAETRKESGAEIRKTFDARLAYYEGDLKTYAESIPADATGFAAVTRALCLGDRNAAARVVFGDGSGDEKSVEHLLLYLVVSLDNDPRAESCWGFLLDSWRRTDARHARLAEHFAGTSRLTDAELLDFPMSLAEKRLFLAAVGLHEPKLRATAFVRARQCNFSREFPHHLVAAALATGQK